MRFTQPDADRVDTLFRLDYNNFLSFRSMF